MKFLDDEERTRLRTQHKRERDGRVRDRIKAVLLYDKTLNADSTIQFLRDKSMYSLEC